MRKFLNAIIVSGVLLSPTAMSETFTEALCEPMRLYAMTAVRDRERFADPEENIQYVRDYFSNNQPVLTIYGDVFEWIITTAWRGEYSDLSEFSDASFDYCLRELDLPDLENL